MFNGKIHYKWPCSIAMLNCQRVISSNFGVGVGQMIHIHSERGALPGGGNTNHRRLLKSGNTPRIQARSILKSLLIIFFLRNCVELLVRSQCVLHWRNWCASAWGRGPCTWMSKPPWSGSQTWASGSPWDSDAKIIVEWFSLKGEIMHQWGYFMIFYDILRM